MNAPMKPRQPQRRFSMVTRHRRRRPSRDSLLRTSPFLQSQHIHHRIQRRLLRGDEFGGGKGAQGITIATGGFDGDFQRLAQETKDDRVLAGVVARADGVVADLAGGSLASLSMPAMAMDGLPHRGSDELS